MKKTLTLMAATAALALSAGAASAQTWQSVNERQANLEARIDAGVRSGDLTRNEARELRGAFGDIATLEGRYRADGLSAWERSDLDRRFDALSSRVRYDRNDGQQRGDRGDRWDNWTAPGGAWMNINQRQARLDQRIDQGVRNGKLTRREATSLRSQFNAVARLETRYRANGLSTWERADLDRRFDALSARLRWEQNDRDQYGAGYGNRR